MKKKLTNHNNDKHSTTPELNKLSAKVFNVRLKQADLETKIDFDDKLSPHQKINSKKTNHSLVEN